MKRIGDLLTRHKTPVDVQDDVTYKQVTIRTNYKGVVLRGTQSGAAILTKSQWRVSADQFILSRIDARNGAFGIIPPELEGAIVTNDFLAFDINETEVEREFFNVFLQSPLFLEACIKASRGNTNRKRVDEDFFLSFPVNLPPISEQHRLIAKINRARAALATAEQEISRQEDLVAKLKQAILQEAITGRLTAGWRSAQTAVAPASQLLARIRAEKARLVAAKKLRPEKPLPPIPDSEIPFAIPEGWEWCRLAETMILRDGERDPISKSDRERREKIYPYYGASGIIDQIDGYTHDGRFLLVGEDGSNLRLRSTPIAFEATGKIWVNNHAHVLEFTEPALQNLIEHRLNGMDLSEFVSGGFQPKLSQDSLNKIPIPLPPLREQTEIVARVEGLMERCRELEAEIARSRAHAAALLQAVLREAFAPAA